LGRHRLEPKDTVVTVGGVGSGGGECGRLRSTAAADEERYPLQVGKLLATLLLVPALIEPAQRRTSKPRCLDPTAADALVRGLICQQSGTSGRGDRMGCQCAQRTSPVCPPEGHRVGRCVRRTSAGFGSTRRRSAMLTTCGTSPVGGGASRESREKALACRTVGARVGRYPTQGAG
jgi:hypothetical protein